MAACLLLQAAVCSYIRSLYWSLVPEDGCNALPNLQVQPVLQRLKTTLTGSGAALLASSVLLFGLIRAGADVDGVYGATLRQCVVLVESARSESVDCSARTATNQCTILVLSRADFRRRKAG